MRKNLVLPIALAISAAAFITSCQQQAAAKNEAAPVDSTTVHVTFENQVKYGEHLVTVGGCGDCHTPKKMSPQGPVPDMDLAYSGHPSQMPIPDIDRKMAEAKGLGVTNTLTAWVGPWGVSYAANLTPDSTGIGNWKVDQFIYALRNGKHKGLPDARPILPPMPWETVKLMSDDELKAMFAYLKTVKPVHNIVPEAMAPVSAAAH